MMKSVYRFRGWSSPSGHGRWRGGFILCALEVLRLFKEISASGGVNNRIVKGPRVVIPLFFPNVP